MNEGNFEEPEKLKELMIKITKYANNPPVDLSKIRKIKRINITRPPSNNSSIIISNEKI